MSPERIRAKAIEKGIIREEDANTLDDRQSLNLIFLPGFSTMNQASAVSGRGVGMDVVKTNIQKLNGSVEIRSEPGKASVFIISLPLTLSFRFFWFCWAINPLLCLVDGREDVDQAMMQEVGGKETLVVRGEVLPVVAPRLLGWPVLVATEYGVLMQTSERSFILSG